MGQRLPEAYQGESALGDGYSHQVHVVSPLLPGLGDSRDEESLILTG